MNWLEEANCIGKDPDLFFPIGSTGPAAEQADEAKTVCSTCRVREECLEWALATSQDSGVWGGSTEEERRAIARVRRRERLAVG